MMDQLPIPSFCVNHSFSHRTVLFALFNWRLRTVSALRCRFSPFCCQQNIWQRWGFSWRCWPTRLTTHRYVPAGSFLRLEFDWDSIEADWFQFISTSSYDFFSDFSRNCFAFSSPVPVPTLLFGICCELMSVKMIHSSSMPLFISSLLIFNKEKTTLWQNKPRNCDD